MDGSDPCTCLIQSHSPSRRSVRLYICNVDGLGFAPQYAEFFVLNQFTRVLEVQPLPGVLAVLIPESQALLQEG